MIGLTEKFCQKISLFPESYVYIPDELDVFQYNHDINLTDRFC
jgi:hypothetical protein